MLVKRYDTGHIKKINRADGEMVTLDATFTRSGIFLYMKQDGTVSRELRPEDEVFKEDSMQSLRLKPLTNSHPPENLTTKTAKQFVVGSVGETITKVDDIFLAGKISVIDEDTIIAVESGKSELSCGYKCVMDNTPGIWNGQQYDAVQRNIKYNHVAIVDRGRAGKDVKIKLDSGDAIMFDKNNEEENMFKVKIDGKEYDVTEDVKNAFDAQSKKDATILAELQAKADEAAATKTKLDATEQELTELKAQKADSKEVDVLQAKFDALTEKSKELQAKADSFDKEVNSKVSQRIKLYSAAKTVCDDETIKKLDSMSDSEIKKAVIATQTKTDMTDKSETYIDVRFDEALENLEKKSDHDFFDIGSVLLKSKHDNGTEDEGKARQDMIDARLNAYKN